jgi:pyruvate/2-oxoglutarate/acetoin dehydrogenase E1 component
MRNITFAQSINEAIREEMKKNDKVYFIGEDIGRYHQGRGPSGVSIGLLKEFGEQRVIEAPISESVIVGSSVGAAMSGMRPIVEIMHSEFLCHCFEHVFYGGCKGSVKANGIPVPLVIRTPFGGVTPGELVQDENNEAWFGSAPGLNIVIPSTPYDAKGLMKSALKSEYPVLFLEHKGLYKTSGEVPEEDYTVPLGKAFVRRMGGDLTVLTYGNMVGKALDAAQKLSGEGVEIEVIDLRTVLPLDETLIVESVKKTGRAIVFHEARKTGGIGGEVAAVISEKAFPALKAPILRVAAPDVPGNFPCSADDLIAGVKQIIKYGNIV